MIAHPASQQPARTRVESSEDSDSDWDEDDDFVAKKINIRIKPVTELAASEKISASADELRASMGTWKSMANINLVKPNSRRSMHQSTIVLNKMPIDSDYQPAKHHSTQINRDEIHQDLMQSYSTFEHNSALNESTLLSQSHELAPTALTPQALQRAPPEQACLPVAIAIQECLHVLISSTGTVHSNLIGHIKMAVPRHIIKLDRGYFKNNDLPMEILTSRRWASIRGNQTFLRSLRERQDHSSGRFGVAISLDMGAIHEHASVALNRNSRPYFLLPELVTYKLQSEVFIPQEANDENQVPCNLSEAQQHISPVQVTTHWLCDASNTKVRTDIRFLREPAHLSANIQPSDLRDVNVSMQVDGNVISHQSKPQASWDPVQSRLSWSFASFQELLEVSTADGVASCLAKLVITDGPSKPSETSVRFSIVGKTLNNVQISLLKDSNQHLNYNLVKYKQEVATGTFKCEPQA